MFCSESSCLSCQKQKRYEIRRACRQKMSFFFLWNRSVSQIDGFQKQTICDIHWWCVSQIDCFFARFGSISNNFGTLTWFLVVFLVDLWHTSPMYVTNRWFLKTIDLWQISASQKDHFVKHQQFRFHKMIVLGAPSKTVFLWNACPKKDDFVRHIGDPFHKIVFLEGAVSQNRLFGRCRFTKSSFWKLPFHKIVF